MRLPVSVLPDSLQSLATVIGLPATIKIIEIYPGMTVFVPKSFGLIYDLPKALVNAIGHQSIVRLCRAYGGQTIFIPRCADLARRARDLDIQMTVISLELTGHTRAHGVRVAARRWGCVDRTIRRVLAKPMNDVPIKIVPGQPAQLDLFQ